jgi:hypothetical protein
VNAAAVAPPPPVRRAETSRNCKNVASAARERVYVPRPVRRAADPIVAAAVDAAMALAAATRARKQRPATIALAAAVEPPRNKPVLAP